MPPAGARGGPAVYVQAVEVLEIALLLPRVLVGSWRLAPYALDALRMATLDRVVDIATRTHYSVVDMRAKTYLRVGLPCCISD